MKIAHVSPVYPPRGGMGTVAKEYVEGLKRLGEDVEIFTPRYESNIVKWGNAAFVPGLLWRLRGFDAIHLHYPFYGGAVFVAIAAFFWRTPLFVTYHMKTKADGWLGVIFTLHRIFLEPFILWRAKNVFVSSMDYANSIRLRHFSLVELPFGVDSERFSPGTAPKVREEYGISEDATVFLFVGGMDDAHYFKGVDIQLHAFAQLPKDQDWHAIMVGGGSRLSEYRNLASDLGISEHVHFAGRVSDDLLPDHFRAANVHLLPSIDRSEAFGLVTLEAAASGLTSVVSDLPGVRTLVKNEETGLIVRPGDEQSLVRSLRTLLFSPGLARKMGVAARERVEQEYAQQVVLKRLQAMYQGVTVSRL